MNPDTAKRQVPWWAGYFDRDFRINSIHC